MKNNPNNGPFRSKLIESIKAKKCPCCIYGSMKGYSIKNCEIDDWRYECNSCSYWEY